MTDPTSFQRASAEPNPFDDDERIPSPFRGRRTRFWCEGYVALLVGEIKNPYRTLHLDSFRETQWHDGWREAHSRAESLSKGS